MKIEEMREKNQKWFSEQVDEFLDENKIDFNIPAEHQLLILQDFENFLNANRIVEDYSNYTIEKCSTGTAIWKK